MATQVSQTNARKGSIVNLQNARNQKNDEFYTILSDIEKELGVHSFHVTHEQG